MRPLNDDEAPAPALLNGSGRDWQVRTGLSLQQAEDLLDWLERTRSTEHEVALTPDGWEVRWLC